MRTQIYERERPTNKLYQAIHQAITTKIPEVKSGFYVEPHLNCVGRSQKQCNRKIITDFKNSSPSERDYVSKNLCYIFYLLTRN